MTAQSICSSKSGTLKSDMEQTTTAKTTPSNNVDIENYRQDGQSQCHTVPSDSIIRKRRLLITALLVLANLMQNISNCIGILGGLKISQELGVMGIHATWIAASYPLGQGTFVLMSGRLGAIFGHRNMLLIGGAWFTVLTLVNGFIHNFIAFCVVRALSGIGGAIILPNCVALIGITNPPGRVRNVSVGFIGASAPIGGYLGGILIGLCLAYANITWCFAAMSIASALMFGLLWMLTPEEVPVDQNGSIDYVGAALGTSILILFNFVWNQAPAVSWKEPYEYSLLLTSLVLLVLFVLWESRAPHPILPLTIFSAKSFGPLMIVISFNFMALGTVLWYSLLWQQTIREWSVLATAVGWSPYFIVAVLGTVVAAWLVPLLGAQWIVAIGSVTSAASAVLLATMPAQQTYWAQMFPATALMALCPDLTYTAAQIIACNAVPRKQQGVAGSLIGTLNLYGVSLGLGFASTVETQVSQNLGHGLLSGYRAALYFGMGLSLAALVIDVLFVRMVKDDREGWTDEDRCAREIPCAEAPQIAGLPDAPRSLDHCMV